MLRIDDIHGYAVMKDARVQIYIQNGKYFLSVPRAISQIDDKPFLTEYAPYDTMYVDSYIRA